MTVLDAHNAPPCMPLTHTQRKRLVLAMREVEQAAAILDAPTGLRIFDAYISTPSTEGRHAGNAYVVKTTTQPKARKPRRSFWEWLRGR